MKLTMHIDRRGKVLYEKVATAGTYVLVKVISDDILSNSFYILLSYPDHYCLKNIVDKHF